MNDIRHTYIRLGFHLNEFERMSYYKDFGYSSLVEFCDANLGFDKSAVSRCISVFKEFAMRDEHGAYKMWLNDKYSNFSYSQLCEMVSMKEEQRKLVKPEMTIKQIRELKKKNVSRKNDDVSQVATSQQDNYLDIKKFDNTYGAARQSMIKKAVPIDNIVLNVFDKSGKPVFVCNNIWVDLLGKNHKEIIIRLTYDVKENEE